jgi:hypothetical protein
MLVDRPARVRRERASDFGRSQPGNWSAVGSLACPSVHAYLSGRDFGVNEACSAARRGARYAGHSGMTQRSHFPVVQPRREGRTVCPCHRRGRNRRGTGTSPARGSKGRQSRYEVRGDPGRAVVQAAKSRTWVSARAFVGRRSLPLKVRYAALTARPSILAKVEVESTLVTTAP